MEKIYFALILSTILSFDAISAENPIVQTYF